MRIHGVVLLLAALAPSCGRAVIMVTPEEMAQKGQWVQQNLLTASVLPPFSFAYGGLASSQLLAAWPRTEADTVLDTNRTEHVITWANNTLQVKCVAVEYNDYPLVEWTVYFKDISANNTPILQDIQGLDLTIVRTNGPEFVVHGNQGDSDSASSYEPFETTLSASTVNSYAPPPYSGRSCDASGWPYFDLQTPDGGMLLAIGWPGQWASSFARDAGNGLRIEAGQQTTYLYLKPGEEIRTPLIAVMFWQGSDVIRAQNLWRHFYLAHILPRVNGQAPDLIWQVQGDSVNQVNSALQAGIQPAILWRDAGWYPDTNGPYVAPNQWLNTGTWEVNTNLYPNGFGPTSQAIHGLGTKFLLWFEPERVGNDINSFLATNNPSWLLPATSSTVGAILNEGDPQVFDWLTNHFDALIKSNGVDWYREDMNGNGPLPAWQNNDASNRQGITENFYVQNHLAFWDALLAMNPGMRIDCCGSGGRRNDLEAMRRAVPLTRSDYLTGDMATVPDGNQCQTYGLSLWLPFQGAGSYFNDPYSFRSFYMASSGMVNNPNNIQAYTECRKVAPIMLNGDYYPLTPYSLANNVWMAWQFDWPDRREGCVQIFRRTNSPVAAMTFKLQGLNAGKLYDVQDFDRGDLGSFTGSELMSTGLTVQLNPRGSAVLYYTNLPGITVTATGNPLAGVKPLVVQFSSSGAGVSGAPISYAWTFGDGGVSTNQNPSHTYVSGGRYLAEVTARDDEGNAESAEVPITVMSPVGWKMKTALSGYSRAEMLTNFPWLMVFGTNLSRNGFSYSQMASSNGWDLVFMNAAGTQPLNYEIEKWSPNGNSYVWVQVPELNSNTSIWAYWGDANLASTPAPCLTNGSVWANSYVGVWHLANGAVLAGTDSTASGHDGTVYNATATSGVVDGGAQFNGANSYLDVATGAKSTGGQQVTMSAWLYPIGGTVVMMNGNDTTGESYGLEWSGNSSFLFTFASTTDWLGDGGASPPSQWTYTTGVIDGNNKYLYVNGLLKTSKTFAGTLSTSDALPLWLGAQNRPAYNYWFNGILDEVRLSSVARSSNWVWAAYMNMASNEVFSSYGQVTPYGDSTGPVHLGISFNGTDVIISWSTNGTSGFVLQTSWNLVDWTNSTAPVVPSGTNNTVTVAAGAVWSFYRLTN